MKISKISVDNFTETEIKWILLLEALSEKQQITIIEFVRAMLLPKKETHIDTLI